MVVSNFFINFALSKLKLNRIMLDIETMLKEQQRLEIIPMQKATKSEIFRYSGAFSDQKIYATRNELIRLLGQPTKPECGKVNYSFFVKKDGFVYEIYDYKENKNTPADEVIGWHIGYDCKKMGNNKKGAFNLWHDIRQNLSILRVKEQI